MMKFCFWYIFEFLPSKGKVATFGKLWFPDSRDMLSAGGGGFYEVSSNKDGSSNTVKEDGTLVLSSKTGHADDSYEKVDTEDEALEDYSTYFVSEDTLIIDGETYTKSN